VSISSTFFACFFCRYFGAKNYKAGTKISAKKRAKNVDEIDDRTVSPIRPVDDPNYYPVGNHHIWNILSNQS